MREPQVAGLLVLVLVLVAASGCAGTRPEPVWPFHESTGEIDAGVNPPEEAYPGPYSAREAISLIASADPEKGLEPGTVTVKEDAQAPASAEELRAKT